MKNIFILPTDKPSSIWINYVADRLIHGQFTSNGTKINCQNQNIYITNNEEIKEGDWCLDIDNEIVKYDEKKYNMLFHNVCKKIILTTDSDLIKDGVQAIDDEFLEWFVNNPSCENVGVDEYPITNDSKGYKSFYKIIIPKQESNLDKHLAFMPKYEGVRRSAFIRKEEPMSYEEFRKTASNDLIIKFDADCLRYSEDGNSDNYFYSNCKYWESKLKEEPKQEPSIRLKNSLTQFNLSLEEVINLNPIELKKIGFGNRSIIELQNMEKETLEEIAKEFFRKFKHTHSPDNYHLALVEFAKWQQERSYSEEEVRKAIQLARLCTLDSNTGEFVDLSGLTEVCTYGLKETYSEDSIIEQFKKK